MDHFIKIVEKRLLFLRVLILISVICVFAIGKLSQSMISESSSTLDFISGFQMGIFIGLEFILIRYVFGYSKAIKEPDQLRILYIKENDERRKFISTQIGHYGFHIVFVSLAFATVISGYFNETVFLTLLGVVILIGIVKASLKLYFWKKY